MQCLSIVKALVRKWGVQVPGSTRACGARIKSQVLIFTKKKNQTINDQGAPGSCLLHSLDPMNHNHVQHNT